MSLFLSPRALAGALVLLGLPACAPEAGAPSLSKNRATLLQLRERVPAESERDVSGPIARPVTRGTADFRRLVTCEDDRIVFKDEEQTGADRSMTPRLRARLGQLAALVQTRWPGVSLRVTEAWDEDREHAEGSLHYEGRAADITCSDIDPRKLGELGRLAVEAGFDWVYFEDSSHVHVSVRK